VLANSLGEVEGDSEGCHGREGRREVRHGEYQRRIPGRANARVKRVQGERCAIFRWWMSTTCGREVHRDRRNGWIRRAVDRRKAYDAHTELKPAKSLASEQQSSDRATSGGFGAEKSAGKKAEPPVPVAIQAVPPNASHSVLFNPTRCAERRLKRIRYRSCSPRLRSTGPPPAGRRSFPFAQGGRPPNRKGAERNRR